MNLEDRLMQDLKNAMKNKENLKKDTIQQIRAQILLEKKTKQKELSSIEIENVIMKEKNKRLDALGQFEKANRKDLIEQTKQELLVINNYLPQPMSDIELYEAVSEIIEQENAKDIKLMGYVIKKCKEKFGNRVSGKQLSDVVKELLTKGVSNDNK